MKRWISRLGHLVTALAVLTLAGPILAKDQVPLKGHGTGVATVLGIELIDGEPWVAINIRGEGVMTHLGHYTTGGGDGPNTWQNPDTDEWFGTYTFVASNGDEVWTTAFGLESSEGVFTITGGTGRFANASGSFDMALLAEPPTPSGELPFTIEWSGTISSPGSIKK
jgi:hypothetical protein